MKQRLADYVADFLAAHGVTDVFSVVGGGAMHLNDALGHHPALHVTYNHHEQASAIAAEAYARIDNKIAALCVTTGPGGTNALTGVVGGWLDSIPMFVISGQVRYDTTARYAAQFTDGLPLRAVGDPQERFGEDALRILRACRFASQLGFAIEDETYDALLSHKHLLARISAERVTHELDGFVRGAFVHDALMRTVDVLAAVLPELVAMKGFDQRSPYHIYDVLEHTAWTLHHAPEDPLVRWAALFHDVGKPASFFVGENGVGHTYGHAAIGVQVARGAFQRLRLPSAFCDRVTTLIAHHDDVLEPTPKAVKRTIARMGGDPSLFAALCKLKRADALAHGPGCADRVLLAGRLEETLSRVLADGEAFCRKKLALDGNAVMSLGVPAGRAVGAALAAALDAVIDDEVENDPASLAAFVRGWAAEQADLARARQSGE